MIWAAACAAGALLVGCTAGDDTPAAHHDSVAALNNSNAPGSRIARGAADAGRAAAAGPARVLVAGTSLTAGLGLDPADAYPALLQQAANSAGYRVRIVNAGLSGETSAGLLRRMDWLLQEPAAVVVIETGANDGLRGFDVGATQENLRQIVQKVRAAQPAARVVLVQMEAPPNLGPAYTARFRGMYPRVAQETGAVLVPFLLDGVAGVTALNQADGIHPNEEGARLVAAIVWQALEPVLAALDPSVGTS